MAADPVEPEEPGAELARIVGSAGFVRMDEARAYIAHAIASKDGEALAELRQTALSYGAYFSLREGARHLANECGEVKVRAERGLGQLDTDANPRGRPPGDKDTPPRNFSGVHPNTRAGWRQLAKLPEEKFERLLADARDDQDSGVSTARILGRRPMVANNSGVSEWYTPAELIAAAVEVLGGIDLDPASTPEANEVVQAARFYTEADNGLARPWAGRVFLNPPYSHPEVAQFANRLAAEYASGSVTAAIALTNNSTDARWWQDLAGAAAAWCFPSGRLKFWRGEVLGKPIQGQALLYLGPYPGQFVEAFAPFGLARRWAG